MSIVKMKRLRLVGMQPEREELLRRLQCLGCVEISQPEPRPDDPAWAALARPEGGALDRARQDRDDLERAMAVLNRCVPHKKGLLKPRPLVSEAALFNQETYRSALDRARAVNRAQEQAEMLRTELDELLSRRAQLQPWLGLDVPLEITSTRDVVILLGGVKAGSDWDALQAQMEGAAPMAQLLRGGRDRETQYLLLLVHRREEGAALEVLAARGFARASLEGWRGTAAENDRRIAGELGRLEGQLGREEERLRSFAGERPRLQLALDRARQEVSREEARGRMLDTGKACFLEGWVPAAQLPRVEQALEGLACAWEVRDPEPEEYPRVPVQLKNSALTRPLNLVTEMYSLPAYDGVDPNPLMAPFFILFYGIMMADMAYGLLMILISAIVIRKTRPRGTAYDLFALMGLCGVSTFMVGALTGAFFGDFIPQLLRLIDPESTFELPALFTPLTDTLAILVGSLVLGFLQVVTGMAIHFVRQVREGHVLDALLNEGAWWLIYAGAALAALGIGNAAGLPVTLIVGVGMLTAGCVRKNPGIRVVGTLVGTVYNGVTGIFSDVLSYSRLMALMLSGSIIASVFNTLGTTAGSAAVFVVVAMVGNGLNFALNILGCFVHDLRLQCLEFFGKFYKDGGRPFRPLAVQTKFVDIVKEEP